MKTTDNQFNEKLAQAVRNAYAAFQRYRLKPDFAERCSPLGSRQAIAQALQSGGLPGASVDDLAVYAFKAMHTMGDAQDFKHFLPRMLELHALEPQWHGYDTNVFRKIRELNWREWPVAEQTALERYLMAFWQGLLHSFPGIRSVRDFYSDIHELGTDFAPFLAAWRSPRSSASLRHLAQFVGEYLRGAREFEGSVAEIDQWLVANAIESELEHAFFRYSHEPFALEFSEAVDSFRWKQR